MVIFFAVNISRSPPSPIHKTSNSWNSSKYLAMELNKAGFFWSSIRPLVTTRNLPGCNFTRFTVSADWLYFGRGPNANGLIDTPLLIFKALMPIVLYALHSDGLQQTSLPPKMDPSLSNCLYKKL